MVGRYLPIPAMAYDEYMQQLQQPAMVHVGQEQFGFQPQAQPPEQYQPAQQHQQAWPNPHQQQQPEMEAVGQQQFGFQQQEQPAYQQQPPPPQQHQQQWHIPQQQQPEMGAVGQQQFGFQLSHQHQQAQPQQPHFSYQYYPTYTHIPQPYAGRQQQEQFPMVKPEIRGTKWRNTKLKGIGKKMSKDQFNIKNRAFKMFQTGQGADCVIEVVQQIDDQDNEIKEFNVHKYVLMLNSDVFSAMFSHENTKESRENRIRILDSTHTAVRQMLIYMYTGELPTVYAIETDAGPLMHLAHKYLLKPLVQLIETELINSLSLKNVFDRVELADLYQMHSLYSSCCQLIRRNMRTVKEDSKWLELKEKAPKLVISILEAFPDDFVNCYNCGNYGHFSLSCPDK